MTTGREVAVTLRKVTYYTEQVNLLEHLRRNTAEVYVSNETQSVEIRFPTRVSNYTHYVAHIPVNCVDINWVREMIKLERHDDIFVRHLDDIYWLEGFSNTVVEL